VSDGVVVPVSFYLYCFQPSDILEYPIGNLTFSDDPDHHTVAVIPVLIIHTQDKHRSEETKNFMKIRSIFEKGNRQTENVLGAYSTAVRETYTPVVVSASQVSLSFVKACLSLL
jgi:hypothetical protein